MSNRIWRFAVRLARCSWTGVLCGVQYGWLAGHTQWVTWRIADKSGVGEDGEFLYKPIYRK